MAVRIRFDNTHNAISPTFVLGTRLGEKLGVIPAENINVSDSFNSKFELQFNVHRFINGDELPLWNKIKDFAVLWCKEWDVWFEMSVEIKDDGALVKQVSCSSIGEAELSQVNLYNVEINTEDDIARDDYVPTKLYDASRYQASLLHRILSKVPHYSIGHVDDRIAVLQRTFSFDNISIYDALQDIAEEIDCIFIIDSGTDTNGKIKRQINAYDLESYCPSCNKRGEFTDICPECEASNIMQGYGDDTTIFISSENLSDEITLSTDVGSVKNCFRLECGDDLMTAAVRSLNPNGSQYIWLFSDSMKSEMSNELVERLGQYDADYRYYSERYMPTSDSSIVSNYNALVNKYDPQHRAYSEVGQTAGYQGIANAYYDAIEFRMYLHDKMMPSPEMSDKTASTELATLTDSLNSVSVENVTLVSLTTANSAILSVAKNIVDPTYSVSITESAYNADTNVWTGKFRVTNIFNESDGSISESFKQINISNNKADYIRQRIGDILSKKSSTLYGISAVFELQIDLSLDDDPFRAELRKYCLNSLKIMHDVAEACVNLMISHGLSDDSTWSTQSDNNAYNTVYRPYREKMLEIESEILLREQEIKIIESMQNELSREQGDIQSELNMERYIGRYDNSLWLELISYRRESSYKNDNYISDGLTNAEIFENAKEFIETAKNEIYKSATLQHKISTTLNNLLVMQEFAPIVDMFSVGNWLRVRVGKDIFKLRLMSYTIDFDDLSRLSVEFSDVREFASGVSDCASAIKQAQSMASSYNGVIRQAKAGDKGNSKLSHWVNDGLALTETKIVNSADNQNVTMDEHGVLCREYLPFSDAYDDRQLKIINKGLYVSDDNWQTAKAGVGSFIYFDPQDGEYKEGYGVIADKLVGNLILSEELGIYNETGGLVVNKNGVTVSADVTDDNAERTVFSIERKDGNDITRLFYIDDSGNIVINGSVSIAKSTVNGNEVVESVESLNEIADMNRFNDTINSATNVIKLELRDDIRSASESAESALSSYKNQVEQYMRFDSSFGLMIGAENSNFKTVIDNNQMAFLENGNRIAYISNQRLNIPSAKVDKELRLGNYAFMPKDDGGVSLVWLGV